jgi:pyridoxamine 5'-phosphate oxidase
VTIFHIFDSRSPDLSNSVPSLEPETQMDPSEMPSNLIGRNRPENPFSLFKQWLEEAAQKPVPQLDAMVLATVGPGGKPSARVVLFKGILEEKILFFTNYRSRKAQELAANPFAAVVFYWEPLQRQIRIEGKVEKVPPQKSDVYFASRPRGSQIAAWASKQSAPIASRTILEKRFHAFQQKFSGQPVPRPPCWGGYWLIPDYFEFWVAREHRLHERLAYRKNENGWDICWLQP